MGFVYEGGRPWRRELFRCLLFIGCDALAVELSLVLLANAFTGGRAVDALKIDHISSIAERNCSASARCETSISFESSRSAIVRATFITR